MTLRNIYIDLSITASTSNDRTVTSHATIFLKLAPHKWHGMGVILLMLLKFIRKLCYRLMPKEAMIRHCSRSQQYSAFLQVFQLISRLLQKSRTPSTNALKLTCLKFLPYLPFFVFVEIQAPYRCIEKYKYGNFFIKCIFLKVYIYSFRFINQTMEFS